jgi:NDP-sugar pyrophosphorylase family protein
MQCVILAGGLGTRMGHRTADRPKAMIEVAGEPFLRHQLRLLCAGGIDDVVMCLGHRSEMIEDEVARNCPDGMSVRCSNDGPTLLGTAGALRLAVDNGLTDEHFMVLYGDSYLRVDYADVWTSFDCTQHHGLMTVWRNDDALELSNAGVRDGKVVVYRKSSDGANHPSMNYIDYGLGILTADAVLALVPRGARHDLASLYETIATRGRLQAYEVGHPFHEIGSESGLAELHRFLTMELQR